MDVVADGGLEPRIRGVVGSFQGVAALTSAFTGGNNRGDTARSWLHQRPSTSRAPNTNKLSTTDLAIGAHPALGRRLATRKLRLVDLEANQVHGILPRCRV